MLPAYNPFVGGVFYSWNYMVTPPNFKGLHTIHHGDNSPDFTSIMKHLAD